LNSQFNISLILFHQQIKKLWYEKNISRCS